MLQVPRKPVRKVQNEAALDALLLPHDLTTRRPKDHQAMGALATSVQVSSNAFVPASAPAVHALQL